MYPCRLILCVSAKVDNICVIILLLIGLWLSYRALDMIFYYTFGDVIDSYRVSFGTLVSYLVNGNLLVVSSLMFVSSRRIGAFLFRFTGIMFVLYAVNLHLLDLFYYPVSDGWFMFAGFAVLLSFGLFLCFYFDRLVVGCKGSGIFLLQLVVGLLFYFYVDLLFYDWRYVLGDM